MTIGSAIVKRPYHSTKVWQTLSSGTKPCPNCGNPVAEGVRFCPSCGRDITTRQPQPQQTAPAYPAYQPSYQQPISAPPAKSHTKLIIAIVAIVVVVVAIIGSIVALGVFNTLATKTPGSLSIVNSTNSVPAGHYYALSFQMINSLDTKIVVNGTFTSSGGLIEVYVFDSTTFTSWQANPNGSYTSYYDSGRVASGNILAHLPDGKGSYYLVFVNTGSTDDSVTANSSVYYLI